MSEPYDGCKVEPPDGYRVEPASGVCPWVVAVITDLIRCFELDSLREGVLIMLLEKCFLVSVL